MNLCLKLIEKWLTPYLLKIFNASIRNGYHPKAWKASIIIALRKEGKGDYTIIDLYRPIALLNTIGKLLEIIIARRISELAETNNLLLETQIGVRRGRLIEIALYLLIKQIHII